VIYFTFADNILTFDMQRVDIERDKNNEDQGGRLKQDIYPAITLPSRARRRWRCHNGRAAVND
jgi:hypothetical protein